jgi:hypothetical protein
MMWLTATVGHPLTVVTTISLFAVTLEILSRVEGGNKSDSEHCEEKHGKQ